MPNTARAKLKPEFCPQKLEDLRAEYLSILREPIPDRLQKLIEKLRAAEEAERAVSP